ncbi:MAG: hypothetical protein D4R76_00655 [Methylococcus sp.]|nr:MAG: hypothetical protein D4R76_00655 [Methylococcus sp.]
MEEAALLGGGGRIISPYKKELPNQVGIWAIIMPQIGCLSSWLKCRSDGSYRTDRQSLPLFLTHLIS